MHWVYFMVTFINEATGAGVLIVADQSRCHHAFMF